MKTFRLFSNETEAITLSFFYTILSRVIVIPVLKSLQR